MLLPARLTSCVFFFDNFTKLSTNRPRGLVQLFNNIKRSLEICKQFAKKKRKKKKKKKDTKCMKEVFQDTLAFFFKIKLNYC